MLEGQFAWPHVRGDRTGPLRVRWVTGAPPSQVGHGCPSESGGSAPSRKQLPQPRPPVEWADVRQGRADAAPCGTVRGVHSKICGPQAVPSPQARFDPPRPPAFPGGVVRGAPPSVPAGGAPRAGRPPGGSPCVPLAPVPPVVVLPCDLPSGDADREHRARESWWSCCQQAQNGSVP